MEIRLNQSIYTDDPHELEVAQRLEPFNPQSWYEEWHRVAEINEEIAAGYAEQGLKVSAHQFYLRAFRFHRASIVYQEDTDATMMPGYMKTREMFDKACPGKSMTSTAMPREVYEPLPKTVLSAMESAPR